MKLMALHDGERILVEVVRNGGAYRVKLGDRWLSVDLAVANPSLRSLMLEDGRQFLVVHHHQGPRHQVSFGDQVIHLEIHDPLSLRGSRREDESNASGKVMAPMPGRVVRVMVAPGDEVQRGAGLLILEAMKMENEIPAPRDGKVTEVAVKDGQTVDGGAALLTIE